MYFVNKVIKKLIKKFWIKHQLLLLYHSQTNRLVKKFNQILYEKLAKLAKKMD